MAYADNVEGPWAIYVGDSENLGKNRGVLSLHDITPYGFKNHLASPDVHIDGVAQLLRMYFHSPSNVGESPQTSGIASSSDGLSFQPIAKAGDVGKFYFRVFQHGGWYYAIAKDDNNGWGTLYRSPDGLTKFEERHPRFLKSMRHSSVLVSGNKLLIFYTRTHEDSPEVILVAEVDISGDWMTWVPSEPALVLKPETEYEGIIYPKRSFGHGPAVGVQAVRDPFVFQDDGRTWLVYSGAGEEVIACAELFTKFA
jgi:hypothetical protein